MDKVFEEGSHIIYVNGKYKGDDDIGKLMRDFHCKSAKNMKFTLEQALDALSITGKDRSVIIGKLQK